MKGAACGGLSRVWRRECRKICLWRRVQLWRSVIYNAETFNIAIHPTHSLALLCISLSLSHTHTHSISSHSDAPPLFPAVTEVPFLCRSSLRTSRQSNGPVHSEWPLINQTEKLSHVQLFKQKNPLRVVEGEKNLVLLLNKTERGGIKSWIRFILD